MPPRAAPLSSARHWRRREDAADFQRDYRRHAYYAFCRYARRLPLRMQRARMSAIRPRANGERRWAIRPPSMRGMAIGRPAIAAPRHRGVILPATCCTRDGPKQRRHWLSFCKPPSQRRCHYAMGRLIFTMPPDFGAVSAHCQHDD